MEPETIHLMNDGLCRTVLMLIQGITLGISLATVLFILVCLATAALDRCAPLRRAARRQPARAPELSGPDEYAPLAALAGKKDGRADRLTGGVARRKPAAILPSARKLEDF